jgi:hypothetical protein
MRYVVAALIVVALLSIWLITRYPDDAGSNEVLDGREVTSGTLRAEPNVSVVDQQALPVTIPDEVISNTDAVAAPIESTASRGRATQTFEIEFDPEQRGKIVDFLSKRGLAVVDSERIADLALNEAKECLRQTFSSNSATSTSIETCMFNVFAAYGLNEIAGR